MDKFEFIPQIKENPETLESKIQNLLDYGYNIQELFSELCFSEIPLFENFSIKNDTLTIFLNEYPGVIFFNNPLKIKHEIFTFFTILGIEGMNLEKMTSYNNKYSFTFNCR